MAEVYEYKDVLRIHLEPPEVKEDLADVLRNQQWGFYEGTNEFWLGVKKKNNNDVVFFAPYGSDSYFENIWIGENIYHHENEATKITFDTNRISKYVNNILAVDIREETTGQAVVSMDSNVDITGRIRMTGAAGDPVEIGMLHEGQLMIDAPTVILDNDWTIGSGAAESWAMLIGAHNDNGIKMYTQNYGMWVETDKTGLNDKCFYAHSPRFYKEDYLYYGTDQYWEDTFWVRDIGNAFFKGEVGIGIRDTLGAKLYINGNGFLPTDATLGFGSTPDSPGGTIQYTEPGGGNYDVLKMQTEENYRDLHLKVDSGTLILEQTNNYAAGIQFRGYDEDNQQYNPGTSRPLKYLVIDQYGYVKVGGDVT